MKIPTNTSDPRGNFLRRYAPSDFDVPMDGLAAVPLHQIGDAEQLRAADLAMAARKFRCYWF